LKLAFIAEAPSQKLWRKTVVDEVSGCWLFTGSQSGWGYRQTWFHDRLVYVHRLSYMMYVGEIPNGHVVDHMCFNPSCWNPEHLRTLTPLENCRNGRRPTGKHHYTETCQRGHKLDRIRPDGRRYCHTCKMEGQRIRRALCA